MQKSIIYTYIYIYINEHSKIEIKKIIPLENRIQLHFIFGGKNKDY